MPPPWDGTLARAQPGGVEEHLLASCLLAMQLSVRVMFQFALINFTQPSNPRTCQKKEEKLRESWENGRSKKRCILPGAGAAYTPRAQLI